MGIDIKKVLVIEDDPFLSRLLINRLKKAGVGVLHALDGEQGLGMLREDKPNLVLLDLILPKKSGFEVLEEIRTDPSIQDVPIIIISNLGQDGDVKRGKELGAVEYFIKAKTSIDGLIERVSQVLAAE